MAKKTVWTGVRLNLLKRAADLAWDNRRGRKRDWIYAAAVLDEEGLLDEIGRTPTAIRKIWATYRKPIEVRF